MKALSLTPPWHVAILYLGKRVENRDWRGCSYRGPILLHASKGVGSQDDFDETVDAILTAANPTPGPERHTVAHRMAEMRIGGRGRHHAEGWWAPHPDLARGAIVGRCRVAGVLDPTSLDDAQRKWWMGGFAIVLANVEAIDRPIPYKGALGFFRVPDDMIANATWTPVGP